MGDLKIQRIEILPIRVRVGLGLAVAEQVSDCISCERPISSVVQRTLEDCWEWLESTEGDTLELHRKYAPDLGELGCGVKGAEETAAYCCAVDAFFYLLWHGFQYDIARRRIKSSTVPADIRDVSEGVLLEALTLACKTKAFGAPKLNAMISSIVERFERNQVSDHSPITRSMYFH